jgi:hypothetical protein
MQSSRRIHRFFVFCRPKRSVWTMCCDHSTDSLICRFPKKTVISNLLIQTRGPRPLSELVSLVAATKIQNLPLGANYLPLFAHSRCVLTFFKTTDRSSRAVVSVVTTRSISTTAHFRLSPSSRRFFFPAFLPPTDRLCSVFGLLFHGRNGTSMKCHFDRQTTIRATNFAHKKNNNHAKKKRFQWRPSSPTTSATPIPTAAFQSTTHRIRGERQELPRGCFTSIHEGANCCHCLDLAILGEDYFGCD